MRVRDHIRSNVVAYLALFFALGGTALAAKPLVTGADVADDSLTGADVLESSLGEVPIAGSASFAIGARNVGSVNRVVRSSGADPTSLFESSVLGLEISGNCGVLRLAFAPGREEPDATYGYSLGDNDESGFFGAILGDAFTIEGANLSMSLVVERDSSFARVEMIKRGCEFTRWITRSEDDDGL